MSKCASPVVPRLSTLEQNQIPSALSGMPNGVNVSTGAVAIKQLRCPTAYGGSLLSRHGECRKYTLLHTIVATQMIGPQ